MRDFERIEILMKEDEKLARAFLHETERIWKLADYYESKGNRIAHNFCVTIGNSFTRILAEKTGYKTKEQLDKETIKINYEQPNDRSDKQ